MLCAPSWSHEAKLIWLLISLPDLEEKRLKFFPPATGALWAHHSGCAAKGKDTFYYLVCTDALNQ